MCTNKMQNYLATNQMLLWKLESPLARHVLKATIGRSLLCTPCTMGPFIPRGMLGLALHWYTVVCGENPKSLLHPSSPACKTLCARDEPRGLSGAPGKVGTPAVAGGRMCGTTQFRALLDSLTPSAPSPWQVCQPRLTGNQASAFWGAFPTSLSRWGTLHLTQQPSSAITSV